MTDIIDFSTLPDEAEFTTTPPPVHDRRTPRQKILAALQRTPPERSTVPWVWLRNMLALTLTGKPLENFGGSSSDDWNSVVACQAVNALWTKCSDPEERDRQVKAALARMSAQLSRLSRLRVLKNGAQRFSWQRPSACKFDAWLWAVEDR